MADRITPIRAKIERAKEHIRNLDADITTYLDGANHTLRVADYFDSGVGGIQRKMVITGGDFPPRLSIIVGEVVHQLRSSLDHLIWQLVLAHGTETPTNDLEFPIFWDSAKYPAAAARKIKGVSTNAAKRIKGLQPYHAVGNSKNHPLFILHDLDIIDKHKLLILVAGELKIWGDFGRSSSELDKVVALRLTRTPAKHPNADYQVAFDVAFDKFGDRHGEPVIPSLQQLTDFVSATIDSFVPEL